MPKDFSAVMQRKSDMQLLEITTAARADYVPEAIAAAEQELANRELAPALQATLQARLNTWVEEINEKGDAPLEWGWRLVFLLFGGSVWGWILLGRFKSKGYHRKYREAMLWMILGPVSAFVLIILWVIL